MSLFRILGTPVLAYFWLGLDWRVAGLVLGTVIGLTDMVDGMVARKLGQITDLGALLDQLGDLVFESTSLILAVMMGELWVGWLILYLTREFTVMVIRSYVLGNGGSLPSTVLGKAKSSFLQWAFFLFFLGVIVLRPGTIPGSWTMVGISPGQIILSIGHASILLGIGLGIMSGWSYLKAFATFYVGERSGPG